MSDEQLDLDEIEMICEEATDGPWHNFFHDDGYWVETGIRNKNGAKILSYCFRSAVGSDAHEYTALSDADERLVIHSRTLIPALVAKVRDTNNLVAEYSKQIHDRDGEIAMLMLARDVALARARELETENAELYRKWQSLNRNAIEPTYGANRVRELEAQLAEANSRLDEVGAR